MKKYIYISIVIFITFILLLIKTPLFFYLQTLSPFYRSCTSLEEGQTAESALRVMNNKFEALYGGEYNTIKPEVTMHGYSSNQGNNCNIYVKNDVVTNVDIDFD